MLIVKMKKTDEMLAETTAEDLHNTTEINSVFCYTLKFLYLLVITTLVFDMISSPYLYMY